MPKPAPRKTYIREWRQHRGLTQAQLAARIDSTDATVSRLETGKIPWSQATLESIADALMTDPASLLMRNPLDPAAIWTLWDLAKEGERRQIEAVAESIIKYRVEGE